MESFLQYFEIIGEGAGTRNGTGSDRGAPAADPSVETPELEKAD